MRKKIFTLLFMFVLTGITFQALAQTTVSGTVSSETETIPGVTVLVKNTNVGTITDMNGKYEIIVPAGSEFLVFSYIGMETEEVKIIGTVVNVSLTFVSEEIAEIMVIADFAQDRKTPVAFSTITPEIITEKLGTQEFPEILKSTPSIYATKEGGGYGDSRINMRGFDSNNIGVLINGVPVNDMESGKVYWSNWAGLSDVTKLMQVQRGLGASKLAISSVGGTINIITRTTDAKKGGSISLVTGNNGYSKQSVTLSTGLLENGWAVSASGSKTESDGYIMGTNFKAYSYFFNVSKRINKNHSLALTAFGAPQWHNQRSSQHLIEDYLNHPDGTKYNSNFGYRNGSVYGSGYAYNEYHKPQISLNHYWNINSETSLSTAVYASKSTGGGRRISGQSPADSRTLLFQYPSGEPYEETLLTPDGYLDYDSVMRINEASSSGSRTVASMSNNSHDWYGILSTLNKKFSSINLTVGLDGRYYKGYHYQEVDDLLGGDYFLDNGNVNRDPSVPLYKGDKFNYNYLGEVFWGGIFTQAEYVSESFSAFISGSVSYTSYRRTDYFNYYDDDIKQEIYNVNNIDVNSSDSTYLQYWENLVTATENTLGVDQLNEDQERLLYLANKESLNIEHTYQTSDFVNFFAYSFKGGANYNINRNHNIFINGGYFTRAPYFRYAFLNYRNDINPSAKHERVLSTEFGYGYRSPKVTANLTLYRTNWLDKAMTKSNQDNGTDIFTGLNALHKGVELELTYKPSKKIKVKGMISVGDWVWDDEVIVESYDENQELLGTFSAYTSGVHVGDAAQTTAALGVDAEVLPKLTIGFDVNYYDNLYAYFDINSRVNDSDVGVDAWQMPAYTLADFNVKYSFKIGKLNSTLYGKINNILDTEYIADATDGLNHDYGTSPVYYGFGRTWSIALKIRF